MSYTRDDHGEAGPTVDVTIQHPSSLVVASLAFTEVDTCIGRQLELSGLSLESFAAFATAPELTMALGVQTPTTVDELVAILDDLGGVDPAAAPPRPAAYSDIADYCVICTRRLTPALGALPATGRRVHDMLMCLPCADALELPDALVRDLTGRHIKTGCLYVLTGPLGTPHGHLSMTQVQPGADVVAAVLADLGHYPDETTVRAWLMTDHVAELGFAPVDELRDQVRSWGNAIFDLDAPVETA